MCTPKSLKLGGILRLWSKRRLVELRCSVQQHPSLTPSKERAKKRREVEWKVSKKPRRFSSLKLYSTRISLKRFAGWFLFIGSRCPGKHILHKQWELIILRYIVWFLWIRGATSQIQIVYLLLSLFCNEPTWLAY